MGTLNQPPYRTPITDNTGNMTPAWVQWFNQVFVGASQGGGTGNYADVTSYGAVADGQTDNSQAFQNAFAANDCVFVPSGNYLVKSPIIMTQGQVLMGEGISTQILSPDNSSDIIQITQDFCMVWNLQLKNGNAAIRMYPKGLQTEVVQCCVMDVHILTPNYGIVLDGYLSPNFPVYWNNFFRILIESPKIHGVWLTVTGAGDTPNANKFHAVRVYSHGHAMTGIGFYVQSGRFNNSFTDCEANLWPSAQACFALGPHADTNQLINFYAESLGALPCVWLQAGSQNTSITNLLSAAAGPAIYDQSVGQYQAVAAGYPFKNHLQKTYVTDISTNVQRYSTIFIDGQTIINVDQTTSYYLLSAFAANVVVNLPLAATAAGMVLYIKRNDASTNTMTVWENGGAGLGPDGLGQVLMNNQYDWLQLICNGAEWFIHGTNMPLIQNIFVDSLAAYAPDLTKQIYLVSAFSNNMAFELPNAHAPGSPGRQITIKRIDNNNANKVTISESNYLTNMGTGPDGQPLILANEYDWITCYCNGAGWWVVAGNLFSKLAVQTPTTEANFTIFGGGDPTNMTQGQIISQISEASPTAANFYTTGIAKQTVDGLYWGINKNSATNGVPASSPFISTYDNNSQLAITQGDSSGSPGVRWVLFNTTGGTEINGKFIITNGNAPSTSTSTGQVGQVAWDATHFYQCVATNTWVRVALATF